MRTAPIVPVHHCELAPDVPDKNHDVNTKPGTANNADDRGKPAVVRSRIRTRTISRAPTSVGIAR